jgi:hypothetical protein
VPRRADPPSAAHHESRFKRLTDAAAFQAMIRRSGCELVLHGHNHRSEVARIAGPHGRSRSSASPRPRRRPTASTGRARYHLIRIEREGEAGSFDVELRAAAADGSGLRSPTAARRSTVATAAMVA